MAASGHGPLVVTRPGEDLVRDVTEILTSVCVLLYGRRAAANRARRAVEAVTGVAS
jgi:predicted site-specific integrase-resolvase